MSGRESNDLTKQESLICVTKKLGSAVHAQDGFAPRRREVLDRANSLTIRFISVPTVS